MCSLPRRGNGKRNCRRSGLLARRLPIGPTAGRMDQTMSNHPSAQYDAYRLSDGDGQQRGKITILVPDELADHLRAETPRSRRRIVLPLVLFLATCASTFFAGTLFGGLWPGLLFSASLMTILVCHEGGHFLQALRHRVPASLPYFIPMPLSLFGTLGAVIAMSPRIRDRRALFDIGVTGPLAGLIPTLLFCWLGLQWSYVGPITPGGQRFGDPLLFKWLYLWHFGPLPPGFDVYLHPVAWAAWVGMLITALNLIPIGQLDGGHVLYALLRRRAHLVASGLLIGGFAAAAVYYWWWLPMLVLLVLIGPRHPPTADDQAPLGPGRSLLGWLTLALMVVGFTPEPIIFDEPPAAPQRQAPAPIPQQKSAPGRQQPEPIMVHSTSAGSVCQEAPLIRLAGAEGDSTLQGLTRWMPIRIRRSSSRHVRSFGTALGSHRLLGEKGINRLTLVSG